MAGKERVNFSNYPIDFDTPEYMYESDESKLSVLQLIILSGVYVADNLCGFRHPFNVKYHRDVVEEYFMASVWCSEKIISKTTFGSAFKYFEGLSTVRSVYNKLDATQRKAIRDYSEKDYFVTMRKALKNEAQPED